MGYLFAILAGMFKALRDRDEWGAGGIQTDSDFPWYAGWEWYRKWRMTEEYIGPFPLDAWHNFDVANIVCAFLAGAFLWPEYGTWTIGVGLAYALPSKWLFYHVLLMRHPIRELREYFTERSGGATS